MSKRAPYEYQLILAYPECQSQNLRAHGACEYDTGAGGTGDEVACSCEVYPTHRGAALWHTENPRTPLLCLVVLASQNSCCTHYSGE